jgi:type IV pilus assembly protein PilA
MINNKKGFTLIEILAVIVIIGIVIVIVVPTVSNIVSSSKDDSYKRTVNNIEDAAQLYITRNPSVLSSLKDPTDYAEISLQQLVNDNLLESTIKDQRTNTNISLNTKVMVQLLASGDYSYKFINGTYATSGLIVSLDGYNAPKLIGSKYYWMDRSGNGNNAELINMANTITSGHDLNNKGYVFDGTNDTMLTPMNLLPTFEVNQNFTIECLFKLSARPAISTATNIFGATSYEGVSINISNSATDVLTTVLAYRVNGAPAYNVAYSYSIVPNKTYLATIVYDYTNSNLKAYINGTLMYTYSARATGTWVNSMVAIGKIGLSKNQVYGGSNAAIYFNGIINRASIYNRALTPTEVSDNYNIDKLKYGF